MDGHLLKRLTNIVLAVAIGCMIQGCPSTSTNAGAVESLWSPPTKATSMRAKELEGVRHQRLERASEVGRGHLASSLVRLAVAQQCDHCPHPPSVEALALGVRVYAPDARRTLSDTR